MTPNEILSKLATSQGRRVDMEKTMTPEQRETFNNLVGIFERNETHVSATDAARMLASEIGVNYRWLATRLMEARRRYVEQQGEYNPARRAGGPTRRTKGRRATSKA